ncbi:MAG: extracellular solute-binding protein [Kiritimatiellia bacterium]
MTKTHRPCSQNGSAVKFLLLSLLAIGFAQRGNAGYIEDRADGTTVIHVKLFDLPNPNATDPNTRAKVAAVQAFKERFPEIFRERYAARYKANPEKYGKHNWDNVEIKLEAFTGIQVEGVETDLLAIAGGIAPDVLYVNFRKSDNYIQNRFLYPLDKPEDHYLTSLTEEEKAFRIHEKFWPVIRRKGPDGNKQVWAMPFGGALGKVLLYRKDLFEQHGLDFPDENWTWEDMMQAVKTISDPGKGVYGIQLGSGKQESWHWTSFLWSAGGEAMEYNEETEQWLCVFDSEEAAVALEYYTRLSAERWIDDEGRLRRGYSSKDAQNSHIKWSRGEIGITMSYIDEKLFSTIDPAVTGMAPVPLGPTGLRGAELNSTMMGLFSGIEDPAVRDAAWEYIRFYDSREANAIRTRIMVEGGLGRFINPKYLHMFGYSDIVRLAPKGWAENYEISIETGKPEPYGKNANFAYELMTIPIQRAEEMARNDNLPEDKTERLAVMQDMLREATARANEQMIGIVSPAERMKRRVSAAMVLTAILISFTLLFRKIFKAFTPPTVAGEEKKKKWDFKRYAWAYLILIPAVLSICVWQYTPLLRGSLMAFHDYRLIGESTFVGLDNFGDLLFDGFWWMAVWNSLRYSFLVLSLTFLPPIILAILLQEIPRFSIVFRTIFYLPAVITGLVITLLWKQFYEPSENGTLNAIFMNMPAWSFIAVGVILLVVCLSFSRRLWMNEAHWVSVIFIVAGVTMLYTCSALSFPILFQSGETTARSLTLIPSRLNDGLLEPYNWLRDPDTAMMACVIPGIWAGMGPGCLIYLAALKGIPDDYYEAADIDGATFIDKILFIVFPTLKALIIINFVGAFIGSWYGATANILVMTGGGAGTETAGLHIWYKAFTYLKFGPATAMAWMLGFMLIGFTVYQLRILSRVEFRAQGANTK